MHPQYHFDLQFKGSCRGFFLLHCYYHIYLWNPSTGFHKQLPLSRYGSSYRNYFYGFGYEDSTDDYFLVSISHDPKLANTKHLEIFSLRANKWKEIEGIHCPYINSSTDYPKTIGTPFNGAIHWFAFRHDHLRKDIILAFDLIERKLFEIPLPIDIDYEATNCDVWVFGEFLSIWVMDYANDTVEIWVLKEYNVHSPWTKTLVLSIDGISTKLFSPICSTKSSDIIGTEDGWRLVKYNDKGQLIESHFYSDSTHGTEVALYTESLLSLPCDNEQA